MSAPTRSSTRGSCFDAAAEVIRTLRHAGHTALLAGGCVRDALLGLEPKDFDVATDALPDRVRELFPRSRFVGEAFGVAIVHVHGWKIEVATFRKDHAYHDGRRPSAVTFTNAREDALRRDFTINGLFALPQAACAMGDNAKFETRNSNSETSQTPTANDDTNVVEPIGFEFDFRSSTIKSPAKARLFDYVGGLADLRSHTLRAIGDPEHRFAEDYLRMLRAVRFAARLDFQLDPATAAAIRRNAPKLAQISRERIGLEVQAMLTRTAANSPFNAVIHSLTLLHDLQLAGPVLNDPTLAGVDVAGISSAITALFHALPDTAPLAFSPDSPGGYPLALAAWHAALHPLQPGRNWRNALCLSNDDTDALKQILTSIPRFLDWPRLDLAARKRLLAQSHGRHAAALTIALLKCGVETARGKAQAARPDETMAHLHAESLFTEASDLLLHTDIAPPPLLTGDDLIAHGFRPGPNFKRILDATYDAQLRGELSTLQDALEHATKLPNA